MEWIAIIFLLVCVLALQLWLLLRRPGTAGGTPQDALEQRERQLFALIEQSSAANRQELGANFGQFQQNLGGQILQLGAAQQSQLEAFARQLTKLAETSHSQFSALSQILLAQAKSAREEQAQSLQQGLNRIGESVNQSLQSNLQHLSSSNQERLLELKSSFEERMRALQQENGQRLEEMRKTVDEKLHATLEQRLGESFRLVSERLEKVHQGLGEMQQLALGVGDLKRVLTNVKTRGTWGEVQLAALLEQMLTPDQYAANVETIPGSGARVEFALKLPGREKDEGGVPVWLPIDAKFPKEQYERLVDSAERADAEGVAQAGRELERALQREAKTIAEKYLAVPHTTDFAILFLPTEGLYAEVMRRPGLADDLQRSFRVSLAGPSTLCALLNSLQMGFRSLALERRSSEVWQVLGAVKTEFEKFGAVLVQTRTTLERAAKNIEQAEVRSRQMQRKLKEVQALPEARSRELLPPTDALQEELE